MEKMSQQDVEESVTQHKLSTEQLDIKEEPETHDEHTPHVHNTLHMDTSTLGTDKYWKFKTLNDELIIKDEPIGHDEDIIEHECSIKDEADLYDQLKDEAQVKCDVTSEEYNNDCSRQVKDKSHKVVATSNTYQCDLCEKRFTDKSYLRRHIRNHNDSIIIFDTSNKALKFNYDLKFHTRSQTKERPYKCYTCDKTFTQISQLKNHFRTHKYPYKYCDICDKAFTQKGHLEVHTRTHTGEKPFKCDICDKAFSHNSTLKRHIRIHTGEKPYECDICNKAFSDNSTLKRHIHIHAGETPYECDICHKYFRLYSSLKAHIRRTHTNKP